MAPDKAWLFRCFGAVRCCGLRLLVYALTPNPGLCMLLSVAPEEQAIGRREGIGERRGQILINFPRKGILGSQTRVPAAFHLLWMVQVTE